MTPEQAEIRLVKFKLLGTTTCYACRKYVHSVRMCMRLNDTEGPVEVNPKFDRCGYYRISKNRQE